jgi:hypothetical protein
MTIKPNIKASFRSMFLNMTSLLVSAPAQASVKTAAHLNRSEQIVPQSALAR